ncbi:MAG: acylneuraminate cytidylyltransferase family protein [Bacteroidales bacterium]
MIDGKSVLAIIPARGGSKGIPKKNIKLLAGKPLIAWTIEEAKKSKYIDRLILSSEDDEIIKVAKDWGCEVPFVRPKELAMDDTPGVEPVLHAINILPEKYDYVCLLQPTSPLRKAEDIDGCIEKCIYSNSLSCVSVCEVEQHPYWMYEIDNEEKLTPLFKNNIKRRQDLPRLYSLNGAIYFIKIDLIKIRKNFIDENTLVFIMNKQKSIDIDDYIDFKIAEILLNEEMD